MQRKSSEQNKEVQILLPYRWNYTEHHVISVGPLPLEKQTCHVFNAEYILLPYKCRQNISHKCRTSSNVQKQTRHVFNVEYILPPNDISTGSGRDRGVKSHVLKSQGHTSHGFNPILGHGSSSAFTIVVALVEMLDRGCCLCILTRS